MSDAAALVRLLTTAAPRVDRWLLSTVLYRWVLAWVYENYHPDLHFLGGCLLLDLLLHEPYAVGGFPFNL